jgi:hypothetical protein
MLAQCPGAVELRMRRNRYMQVGAPAAGLGASAASFRLGNPTRRPTCRPIFHQESPRTTRPTKSTPKHAGEFGGAERLDPYGRLSLPARAGGGISQPSWCSSSLSHISTLALPYAVYRSVVQRRGRVPFPGTRARKEQCGRSIQAPGGFPPSGVGRPCLLLFRFALA